MASATEQALQALTIIEAGERLAIPANKVAEVVRTPLVTRVPLGPPGLLGVANLRGTVIPILSLAALLGKASGGGSSARIVVVDSGNPIGLSVDEVSTMQSMEQLPSGADRVRVLDVDALLTPYLNSSSRREGSTVAAAARGIERDASDAAPMETLFSFEVAGQQFALPVDSVREVLAVPEAIAVVPRTDDAMLGVVTVRDRLLPLISLCTLLGLDAGSGASANRIVVAVIGNTRVGLAVDAVKTVLRVSSDDIDPVPIVLTRGRQEAQIQAICRVDEGKSLVSILSTEHLLKDGLAERLAAESNNGSNDVPAKAASGETEQFVVFQLGQEHYGLPIGSVVEVVALPEKLTSLPKAPKFIAGLMNLRGQVVPVIDQRRRFEAPSSGSSYKSRIVIVRIGAQTAGFVVDNVSEVLTAGADQLCSPPEIASQRSKVINRIANLELEGRIVLLLNPEELLDRVEQDMLTKMHKGAAAKS